ncbi:Lysophospholipase NTE1 [Lasiodiplodia theobromae]|nr:Lysophospholipase NTE1 [Lasiodiplodia theobromae]KAF4546824.1 Lysophospholipase NTE1 [Lasiodiplodia theobromae]
MSIIITWTRDGHIHVQLAVRSYSAGYSPFDDVLKAAIRDGGLSKVISLPVQQWLSRNVQPGQSIICQLFFDGRIGWHHAQYSQQEV